MTENIRDHKGTVLFVYGYVDHKATYPLLEIAQPEKETTVRQPPIDKLHHELLVAIFDAARRRPPFEDDIDDDEMPTLEVISHVSRHWRHIVLGVPYFWTDLVIKLERSLDKLFAYLERSQQCQLYITLENCSAVSKEKTLAVLDSIAMHKDRWRQFVLKPHEDTDIHLISSYLSEKCSFPNLQCLRLFLPYNPPAPETPPPQWSWFSFCSGLSTLELYIHRLQTRPTVSQFRTLVKSSPSLENLTLVGEVFDLMPDHGHATIEIPSLTSLSIGTGTAENVYFGLLLQLLSTPALEALELWSLDNDGWSIFRSAVDVESKKYPNLKSLALVEVDFDNEDDQIGSWLASAFPMLQHLTLLEDEDDRQDCFSDIVIRFLHLLCCPVPPSPGSHDQASQTLRPTIWQYLHTLTISDTCDSELLRDMLISRAAVGHPISMLQLDPDIKLHFVSTSGKGIQALVHVEDFCKELVYPWNTQPRHWNYQMNTNV